MAWEAETCVADYPGQPPGVGVVVNGNGDGGGLAGIVRLGVRVGRGVEVAVGVGDTYHREVGVSVRVGGMTGEGVIIASGGYSSSMAGYHSIPPVEANSLKRAAG